MKIILKFIIISLTCLIAYSASAGDSGEKRGSAKAKSRYYYYEGLRQSYEGNEDAAYECYKRAYASDTGNLAAAYKLGSVRTNIFTEEMQSENSLNKSLEMMGRFVNTYPTELYEGMTYAYMLSQTEDSVNGIRVFERLADEYPDRGMILVLLSQAYHRNGNTPKAIEVMDRYEQIEGRSAPLSLHKMSMMMEASDTAGAIREVDRLIASDPSQSDFVILKGNLFDVINNTDSAEYYYLKAERMSPESGAPKMALMEIYHAKGDSVAYDQKTYEALLTEDLDRDDKMKLLGSYMTRLFYDNSSKARGDYLFSVLLSQYPHDADVLEFASRFNAYKGDFDTAVEQIGYAIDLSPADQSLWRSKIYYQLSADQHEEAIETYNEAADKMTLDREMKVYGAMVMHQAGKYDESLRIYKEVVADIDPGLNTDRVLTLRDVRRDISMEDLNMLSGILSAMGDVVINRKDTTEAYRYYEEALEMNPDNALAANNFAYFSACNGGDLDKALELSARSLRGENADDPTYLDTYAWILYLKGDYAKALEIQQKTVDAMKRGLTEDVEVYDHYGDILYKNGKTEQALEAWKQAQEVDPDKKGLKGKIEKAEKEIKK